MRKTLLFLLWFVGHWAISQSVVPNEVVKERLKTSAFKNIDVFSAENNSRNSVPSDIKEYSILNLKRESIKSLLSTYSENIELSIPSTDRSNLTLQLVEIRYDDMKVFDAGSKKQIKYKKGKHYRGQIKGNDKSLVALSFFENDVMGFISDERNNGNLVIGKMQDNSEQFIIYKDDEMMKKLELNCGTKGGISDYSREVLFHDHEHGSGERALTDCVRFFYEVDDDIVTEKGGATNATNYVTGLHNQVAALYAAESINVLISEIFVWTTTSPYNGTSSGAMLTQFEANKNGFNGNLAMLLSYEASGGIAYVNTLCSNISDYRMGFSSIYNTYANVPTYSWSVNVLSHEFGHLFGSQHTHDCVWNGNNTAIDGCSIVQGGCSDPGLPPAGSGTIMSYCHTTSVGVNFANGFGPQPGNVIRNSVTVATCLNVCPGGPPTCTDGIQNGNETGIDCGGTCPPCAAGCTTNLGLLTLVLDEYPTETSWTITNSSGVVIYSGGGYQNAFSTVTVPVCLPDGCYNFNMYDSFGDGICCLYGNGSYNLVINSVNVASGGVFATQIITPFCLASGTCTDGIQNGTETGIDCGGSCPACVTCSDGIQNGTETGVDCGGSCPACPTCNDGIQNGTETGIDCGGSCGFPVVSITGSASICVGSTTTLSPNTGGTWSSSNPAIATVTNAGVVTGVAAGTATFIFTNTAGCASLPTAQITVNARPLVSITGSASICIGSTTTLSPGTGGTWSSSNPTIATVTNLGVVTGVTGGTATFIFTSTTGCASLPTAQITVNARPVVSITGSASICVGSSTTLSPNTGGTWSSSNPAIATVTNAGVVIGVSPGFTTFTFTNTTTGCQSLSTAPITINPSPNVSITGSNSICEGATTTLSPTTGGTWTSSDPLKATVTNAGLVTAVSSGMFPSGNVTFTFTSSAGCISQPTPVVVINAIPNAALNGQDSTCVGSTTQLITSMAGQNGTWTSSNPSVAIVSNNSSNFGTVTGLSLGTSTFTIITTAGCVSTLSPQLTIIPEPIVSILGNDSICVGTTTALSPSTPGTWTTSNSTRATVSTTGIVTGVSPGFAYFGYTSNLGCAATNNVLIRIVNKPIASIVDTDSICISGTTTLQPSSGGTWTSSDESVATVTNEGVVTGVALGSASFIFTNDIGCASLPTSPIVVTSTIPVFVSIEDTAICEGSATYLYPQFGGTWTSDNENIAYVEFEYAAIGVFPGTTTFTFTGTNGCITQLTNALTVKPVPSVTLNGSDTLCVGSSTTVSPSTGGNWESSNYGVGYIQGIYPGILTGISEGFVELTFTADNGCVSYLQATVVECPTCYDGIQNGDETGIDCGGSCPFPVITGVQFTNLCIGQQIQLYHTLPGATTLPGVYTSSNSSVASIDPTSGVVNALSVGTVTFTFTSTGGCTITSDQYTVNPLPVVSFPSVNNICVGTMLNLAPTSGGEWFTNDSLIAIPTNTGVLSCLGVGSTLITFRDSIYFCKVDTEVSVINCTGTCTDGIQNGDETGIDCGGSCQACPTCSDGIQNGNETGIDCGGSCGYPTVSIIGSDSICVGSTTTLSPSSGGTWESSNPSVATVSTTGVVTGLASGSATFTFTNAIGCSSLPTNPITINGKPAVSITGSNSICIGLTTSSLSPNSGGTWTTSNPSIAIVTNTGIISCTGTGSGTATFTFTNFAGCESLPTLPITVNGEACITCGDELHNGIEENIDCGGACQPCITCRDGILNQGETSIDCGGPSCAPCTTCEDGIQNGDETSVDCGGSCGIPHSGISANITSVCVGGNAPLYSDYAGTWTSSNPAIATVTNAGIVTGVSPGQVFFTFTNVWGCSINNAIMMTVNDTSVSYSTQGMCTYYNIVLPVSSTPWITNNSSIATVTYERLINVVASGQVVFSSTSPSGCVTSFPFNIIPLPTITNTGNDTICAGSITTFTSNFSSEWYSTVESVATVSNTGVVTAISAGDTEIYCLDANGYCFSQLYPLTIIANPEVLIAGSDSICVGSTTTLSPSSGGTWASSNPAVATVSTTGVVTGLASGSATFTFTNAIGCSSLPTNPITINGKPAVSITGSNSICIGSTTTLSPTTGGTWTSSNASVATVTNAGVVTGVADGTATFIFTNTAGCASLPTAPITINAYSNITLGSSSICIGSTTTYGPNSGTWVSSNSSVATITNAGVVTGISEGSAYFTFTNAAGCTPTPTAPITVNAIPVVSISGSNSICIGSTTVLSPTTGGTWTSNNPSVATVTNAGVVTGVAAGTATFIFTNTAGCASLPTPPITINAYTSVTLGSSSICVGSTTTYGPNSGTWVSSNSSVATITNAGVVTGISEGSAYFTFTNAAGCTPTPTAPITVNAIPVVSISGSNSICIGSTTVLSPTTGGTWTSNNPSIATVTNAGVVTGLAAGSATFIFTSTATGCASNATGSITINAKPAVTIYGANSLCIGSTTTLSPTTGGTWTSSNASVATVTNAGVVTGVAAGSATFTFTSTATGCVSNATGSVTINAKPAVTITGANSICIGSTTTLSPTTGGTWTSSNASVATVTNAGVVTGVAAGSATFTFTSTATGCVSNATGSVTINAKPAVTITGANSICIGSTTTLSPTTGGTWTSSNASVATVTNGGVVTGLAAGSATFTFTSTATGCTSDPSSAISIAAKPVVSITGGTSICVASTSTLSPSTGGTWASNNSAIATVTNAGVVTGVTAGNATFTFTNSTGCASNPTPTITIKAKPVVSITGSASICVAATTTLSPTTGGTWTSSNTAIATITNGGVVTGVAAGSATFTFTNTTTTCSETSGSITVSAKPVVSITGGTSICVGSTSTLSPSTGGTWTSSNTAIATVTNGGVVTGVAAGSTTFTFTNSTGCISLPTSAITIKAKPVVSIIGYSTVCVGSTTKLSPTTGGTWASSNTAIATVTNAGIVTGVTAGAVTFTFTNTTSGCSSTTSTITVESCTNLIGHYFETGWDNWVDGGVDAARYTGVNSAEGLWSIQLRDNSGVASAMTSQTLTTAGSYSSLKVNFKFKMVGVETGEDFWLQYSSNGTTWTTVKTWVRGTTYLNNEFYDGTATLNSPTYTLTNTAKFRFVSDASDDSDVVYIDAVVINGYSSAQASNNQLVSRGIENEEEVKVIEENITYNIYPNPVNSILNINMTNFDLDKDISIKIYSVTGTLIETIKPDQSLIYYDVSGLNTGLYLMLITENDVVKHTEKVNVSH
jgi:uncharacterized protein YjdB